MSDDDDDDDDDRRSSSTCSRRRRRADDDRRPDAAEKGSRASRATSVALDAARHRPPGMRDAAFSFDDGDDEAATPGRWRRCASRWRCAAARPRARPRSDDARQLDDRALPACARSSRPHEPTLREPRCAHATATEIARARATRFDRRAGARVAEERGAPRARAEARDARQPPRSADGDGGGETIDAPQGSNVGTPEAPASRASDGSDASSDGKRGGEALAPRSTLPDAPPRRLTGRRGGDAHSARANAASVFGAGEAKERTKSKGERFFERLVSSSADTENVAENVDATDERSDGDAGTDAANGNAANGTSRRKDVVPPRGFISPASAESDVSSAALAAAGTTRRRVGWRRRRRVPS